MKSFIGKNNPFFGKHHSHNSKEKMRKAHTGRHWKCSEKAKKNISISKIAEKNPMWKGDDVGYSSLHEWVKNRLPKPNVCQQCKKKKPHDLANKSGKYLRDLTDWEWICRRCHMKKDGRLSKMIERNKKGLGGRNVNIIKV